MKRVLQVKMANLNTPSSQNSLSMEIKIEINPEKTTTVDGMMTIGRTDNGRNVLDFKATELVEITPFIADCKVQVMHDGNTYITEKPKRIHNKPLFREDNSSLTIGRDGKYHFIFTMPAEQVDELPEQLVLQALAIAQKVERHILKRKEEKR